MSEAIELSYQRVVVVLLISNIKIYKLSSEGKRSVGKRRHGI